MTASTFAIGPHQIEIEEEFFVVHWRGDPELGPLIQVYERLEEFITERGYALALFDLRQAGLPGSELRRWASLWWRRQKPGTLAAASYGMGTALRTVMTLVNRAVALFEDERAKPTGLFGEEQEARRWLNAQRDRLATVRAQGAARYGP